MENDSALAIRAVGANHRLSAHDIGPLHKFTAAENYGMLYVSAVGGGDHNAVAGAHDFHAPGAAGNGVYNSAARSAHFTNSAAGRPGHHASVRGAHGLRRCPAENAAGIGRLPGGSAEAPAVAIRRSRRFGSRVSAR